MTGIDLLLMGVRRCTESELLRIALKLLVLLRGLWIPK